MSAIYLLRHGRTEWSENGRHTGRTDIPLTGDGERLATAAAATLLALRGTDTAPALVLSSPRQRAWRTAELAGLAVTTMTEDVAEWDYGTYEGLTTPQIRESVPGWTVWTHPCPGGETAAQVTERARRVIDTARAALDRGDVIIVGHGQFSRALTATWIGLDATGGVHFGLHPACVTVLGDERGRPQIEYLNVPPA